MLLGTVSHTCCTYSQLCPEIHSHSHMSRRHIQRHAYVVCFQKHVSGHIKEETCLEKHTSPGRHTTSCLLIHITKQMQQGPTLARRSPAQKHILTHTHLTPPETLGHVSEMDTAWHPLKLEAHIHMHTHTQTHTDSLHTGTGIHGNPHTRPCQAGTDASSLPRYPHGLFYKGSSRGPGLVDLHPTDTRRDTQPCTHKQGHEHRALTRQACSLC